MRGIYILLVAFVLYFVSIFGGYVQDDRIAIVGDSRLGKLSALATSWTEPYYNGDQEAGAYRPVTSLSFGLNSLLLGREAWGFRLVNVLLYSFLCWTVYEFLKKVFLSEGLAFGTTLLFSVHPVHVEAVSNIVGRSELLSLLFGLWMIIFAMDKKWEVSVMMFLFSVFSKESGVIFSLIFLVILWGSKVKIHEKWGASLYCLVGIVGYFVMRFLVLGMNMFSNNATLVENPLKFLNIEERLLGAISVMTLGFEKLLFPLNLSYDYSFNQLVLPKSLFDIRVFAGLLIISLYIGTLAKRWMSEKWRVSLLVLGLPLLVTSNILLVTGTIFGERLWLTPSLGFLMIGALILNGKFKNKYLRIVGMIVLIMLTVRTVIRNTDWLSEKNLFLHDVMISSNSVLALNNEATVWLKERNFERAKSSLEKADKVYTNYEMLMNNWGIYYWWTGDNVSAETKFLKCIEEYPESGLCKSNYEDLMSGKK